ERECVVARRQHAQDYRALGGLHKTDPRQTSNIIVQVLRSEGSHVDELEAMTLAMGEFIELEDVRDYIPPTAFKPAGDTEEERV
ncbi:hypothetical protein JCM5296_003566, partial [Sporobolomyces johnsonii]